MSTEKEIEELAERLAQKFAAIIEAMAPRLMRERGLFDDQDAIDVSAEINRHFNATHCEVIAVAAEAKRNGRHDENASNIGMAARKLILGAITTVKNRRGGVDAEPGAGVERVNYARRGKGEVMLTEQELAAIRARAQSQAEQFEAFGRKVAALVCVPEMTCETDTEMLLQAGEECGVMRQEPYDPEKHGEHECCVPGEDLLWVVVPAETGAAQPAPRTFRVVDAVTGEPVEKRTGFNFAVMDSGHLAIIRDLGDGSAEIALCKPEGRYRVEWE